MPQGCIHGFYTSVSSKTRGCGYTVCRTSRGIQSYKYIQTFIHIAIEHDVMETIRITLFLALVNISGGPKDHNSHVPTL